MRSVGAPTTPIGDVDQLRGAQDLPAQHDRQRGFTVGQFDDPQFQFRGLRGDELVADGGQRDVIELAGDGNAVLVDQPHRGKPVTDGEEPVFRCGGHVAQEGVRGDGVVHGPAAHPFTVDEQRDTGGDHSSPSK